MSTPADPEPAPADGAGGGETIWSRDFVLVWLQLFLFFGHIASFLLFPLYIKDVVGLSWVGWVMGAFPLGSLLTQPLFGRLCDRYGRRPFVFVGCGICVTVPAVMIFGFQGAPGASTSGTAFAVGLIVLRFIHGAGVASATVALLGAVADLAPAAYRGRTFMFSGLATLGATVFMPPTTEWVINHSGYATYLGVTGLLALITLVPALFTRLPRHAEAERSGGGYRTLLGNRNILALGLVCFGFALGEGALLSFAPVFIKTLDAGSVSALYVTTTLVAVASRIGLARFIDRIGYARVVLFSIVCATSAVAAMGLAHAFWHIVVIAALYGLSLGPLDPALNTIAVEESGSDTRARAIALKNVAYEGGYTGGPWICGQILAYSSVLTLFLSAAAMMLVGLGSFLALYRRRTPG